jgi:hypothetical protein
MMISMTKTLGAFALTFTLLTTLGGCSEINEAIDCDELCDTMENCIDSNIDVHDCAERCEDRVEDNALADKLDACTDCLEDRDVSCSEMADECTVCDEVWMAVTP